MNAVNLIPLERRRDEAPRLPGVPFLGLCGALAVALAGTVGYVEVHNTVSTRQSELSQLRTGTAEWSAAAARFTPAIAALRARVTGFARLDTLLGERYDWSELLGQIAGVMPAHAEIASLSAATPIQATTTSASSGTPATSTGTATTSSGTSTASPASTTGTAPAGSAITITGCAVSQPVVADTMVALRRLSDVSTVSLSSSALQGASGTAGSGTCKLPVQFSLSVQFAAAPVALPLPDAARGGNQTSTTAQLASSTQPAGAAR
jgi:hypothetical protein